MCLSQKTFSVAMFCAAMALTFSVEIVVFSTRPRAPTCARLLRFCYPKPKLMRARLQLTCAGPARRASRKILERMREFASTLGLESLILEYNQENLRVSSLCGGTGLIRSFPSKVSVRLPRISNSAAGSDSIWAGLVGNRERLGWARAQNRTATSKRLLAWTTRFYRARGSARRWMWHVGPSYSSSRGPGGGAYGVSQGDERWRLLGSYINHQSNFHDSNALGDAPVGRRRGDWHCGLEQPPHLQARKQHVCSGLCAFLKARQSLVLAAVCIVVGVAAAIAVISTVNSHLLQLSDPVMQEAVPAMRSVRHILGTVERGTEGVDALMNRTLHVVAEILPALRHAEQMVKDSAALVAHLERLTSHPSMHVAFGDEY